MAGLAGAIVTRLETVAYQPCNTVPPLVCASTQASTFVRVGFKESLDGSPTTTVASPWTVVAANTQPTQTNTGLNNCGGGVCAPLKQPLYITTQIVRALVVEELELVASDIPYGAILLSLEATGSHDVPILADPTQLDASITCAGAVAPLSAKGVCFEDAPPISEAVIGSQLGAYPDQVMTDAAKWLPTSQRGLCSGVICYSCPAGGGFPSDSTLYTAYPFGPPCSLYRISSPSAQANYEIDVSMQLTTASGAATNASIFFTSLSNFGTGGQLPSVQNTSFSQVSRGWFESLSVSAGDKARLTSLTGRLEGGMIMVCNADGSSAKLDQGFFYPWDTTISNNVPTATGLGGTQSWAFIDPDLAVTLTGTDCGKSGQATNLAPRLSQLNLTNACSLGLPQRGFCVPGYLNDPNSTSTSLTPALIISQINQYAEQVLSDDTTPPPRFLPPLWNPQQPQYYLRVLPNGSYQLVYQQQNFDEFDVEGTFVVQISNDVVQYSNVTQGVTVSFQNTICSYWTTQAVGALQFQVCNVGNSTTDTTFYLQLLGCSDTILFTNESTKMPPLTIPFFYLAPGQCAYSPSIDIATTFQPGNYVNFVPNTPIPIIGTCQYIITDSSNQTALVGSFDTPATQVCIAVEYPLRRVVGVENQECGFFSDQCDEDIEWWIWGVVFFAIILVIIAIGVIGLIVTKALQKTVAKSQPQVT